VTNWHVFDPQVVQQGGVSAKVARAGVPVRQTEVVTIGPKSTTARGRRYLSLKDLQQQVGAGILTVTPGSEETDAQGHLTRVRVESVRYVESDTHLVNRIIGREVGGKQNLLVFNDEAHHAYRIRRPEPEEGEVEALGEEEEAEQFFREATVWVEGLDRVHKLRGINLCIDLSATPYYLGRVGQETNKTFPWVVSNFGLTDAIESGLVKISQLAVRDTSGDEIPGYFNIWRWILPKLTAAERGREEGQSETGGDPQVREHPHRHARRHVGGPAARMGHVQRAGPAPTRLHPGLQEHEDREGHERVAGGEQAALRHSAREHRGVPERGRAGEHHPG